MDVLEIGCGAFAVYIKARELAARKLKPGQVQEQDAQRLMREALSYLPSRSLVRATVEAYPGQDELVLLVQLCKEQTVRLWFPDRRTLMDAVLRSPADIPAELYLPKEGFLLVLQLPFGKDCPPALLALGREWEEYPGSQPPEKDARCLIPHNALGALRSFFPFPPAAYPPFPHFPA